MTDHRIVTATFPAFRTGLPASILCACTVVMAEAPNLTLSDPHQPIREAFAAHRRDAGAAHGRNGATRGDGSTVWMRRLPK